VKEPTHAELLASFAAHSARAEERHTLMMAKFAEGEKRDETIRLTIADVAENTSRVERRLDDHIVDCHRIPGAKAAGAAEAEAARKRERHAGALYGIAGASIALDVLGTRAGRNLLLWLAGIVAAFGTTYAASVHREAASARQVRTLEQSVEPYR
jgi:hypothetical protein